jgi:hypothetical protein
VERLLGAIRPVTDWRCVAAAVPIDARGGGTAGLHRLNERGAAFLEKYEQLAKQKVAV